MANLDRPQGFMPVGTLDGSPWNARVRVYPAGDRSSDATNNHGDIYVGDPVKLVSGAILPANSGDTVLGVAVAAGGDTQSVSHNSDVPFFPPALDKRHLALDEDGNVWVCLANNVVFEVQTASGLSFNIGGTLDHNLVAATAHGSRVTGLSNVELVADDDSDVQVVDVCDKVDDNDPTAANARLQVIFTTIEFVQAAAG